MFPARIAVVAVVAILGMLIASERPAFAAESKVTGLIKHKGKVLEDGKVTFHFSNGQFAGSKLKEGRFEVDIVPKGTYRVTIDGEGVPSKYSSEQASPLTVQVKEGKNEFDLNLE